MSFEQFVRTVCRIPTPLLEAHLKPQYVYLQSIPLNHIGKVENFDEDIQPLINRFDLNSHEAMNVSSDATPWEEWYTPELKTLVYKKFKRDFELFGYDS